ncbi:DUF1127 domain-containing protein [Pseudodonghicola flavimaris]|uniref:DUF1127 domain-containing protein n=1 Tax=Pseudodonghicola flavimaris TaxID=3050036 RepID=A0ABT7F0L2_9RHOB|nr:DUF1127 domain-containing protein [Pseudodonghicola flavimaris]MDK3018138.1 DUF1127 domain-containing protein [Pseudodonghicola flavimaris]
MAFITLSSRSRRSRPALIARLAHMISVHRQRRALIKLDDRALEDIGISRSQARAEASRPFWDAPESWRC